MSFAKYSDDYLASTYAEVGELYFKKATSWLKFVKPAYFGFYDENTCKPGIKLPCGIDEEEINYKQLLLLKDALSKNPNLLNDFFDLIHNGEQPSAPEKSSFAITRRFIRKPINKVTALKLSENI